MDMLGMFHAERTSICLDPHLNKGRGKHCETSLSPPVKYSIECRKAVLLLWIIFVIYVSCISCFLVCSLQPCGHLLEWSWPFGSLVRDVLLRFVTFPYGVLGQVCNLIVSIPDLSHLFIF